MDEKNIYFWMSVHGDYAAAVECLADLRRHFPRARLAVRADGDADPRYAAFRERFAADVYYGPRLFTVENGGALVSTMLEMFLLTDCRYLFKIDPDTHVHRPFRELPLQDCIFGTVQGETASPSIQGGCLGITRNAARALLDSKLLAAPELCCPQTKAHEATYWRIMAERAQRVGLASFDWSIGWAAQQLNLPLHSFSEVRSTWQTPAENNDLRYAITHPREASQQRWQYRPKTHPLYSESHGA